MVKIVRGKYVSREDFEEHFDMENLAQKDMINHVYIIADPFNDTYNMGRHMTAKNRNHYK